MTTKNPHKENMDTIQAEFKTNMGDFTATFYAKECPETVWNFINLAEGKQEGATRKGAYYDGLNFHRVIKVL